MTNHQLLLDALQSDAKRAGAQLVRLYGGDYLVIVGDTRQVPNLPAARQLIGAIERTCHAPLRSPPWTQLHLDLNT